LRRLILPAIAPFSRLKTGLSGRRKFLAIPATDPTDTPDKMGFIGKEPPPAFGTPRGAPEGSCFRREVAAMTFLPPKPLFPSSRAAGLTRGGVGLLVAALAWPVAADISWHADLDAARAAGMATALAVRPGNRDAGGVFDHPAVASFAEIVT
jgi:hypothetical protein